ncbi:aminopeptidase [Youngiibacter multivorans]|uniref:Aminopeptidase n=1 Tax=Youngiibacter multivorans TaxID=937251 RepID=A0ABS4G323_9CLOT|nr:aminopeptidase [Youngiibacter multivorans]MBP1918940.1 aminopeptidase [Youngiibacter multivorans]
MKDERLEKLAKLLVGYSTGVKEGDFVYVRCDEVALPWAKEVVKAAIRAGAHVETVLTSDEIQEIVLKNSSEEQLEKENELQKAMMEKVDVWLTAWGSRNLKYASSVPSEKIKSAARGASSWRKIYTERTGDGTMRWCGTQFPTFADAQEAGMSLEDYEDFVYGAGLLDTDDPVAEWKRISHEQERWVRYLDTKKELHILSEGTDIKVSVSGRKWINCDGRQNFPDGEIFTSPVHEEINGHVSFTFPLIYAGKEIRGIRLEVVNGRVVDALADEGQDLLQNVLDTDAGSRFFGEVAIGTNYGIKDFTKNTLFDEKIGGTFHMAIGDSMPEAGGKNSSSVHWDMIGDLRKGGSISADGEVFYRDGEFLMEVLERFETV